jgi:hypothetical protein
MPFGLSVKEGIKILVGQFSLQGDAPLSKHFDGKISDERVSTADSEPKDIGLLLVVALN